MLPQRYVLLISENERDCARLERLLAQDPSFAYELNRLDASADVLNALRARRPDLLLLDHRLRRQDGLQLLAKVRADLVGRSIAVVLLADAQDQARVLEGLRMGAQDYLDMEYLSPQRLSLAFNNAVLKQQFADELLERQASIERAAKDAERQAARLSMITGLSRALAQFKAGDASQIADVGLQSMTAGWADGGSVWLNTRPPLRRVMHRDEETLEFLREMKIPDNASLFPAHDVGLKGESIFFARLTPDFIQSLVPEYGHLQTRFALHSLIVVPICIGDHVLGALELFRDRTPEAFSERDFNFAYLCAEHIAMALDHAQLFAELKARGESAEFLLPEAAPEPGTSLQARHQEERLRASIGDGSEGIWRAEIATGGIPIDAPVDEQVQAMFEHGYLSECNDVMARMYGFDHAGELRGVRVGELLPASKPENVEYLRAFVRSGYHLRDEESIEIDRHGQERHFLNNLVGVVEEGLLLRAWGTQRDITALRQAEAALRESEASFRQLAANLPDVVARFDRQRRVVFANQAVSAVFGLRPEFLLGKTLQQTALGTAHIEALETGLRRAFTGEPFEKVIVMGREGERRHFQTRFVPERDAKGEVATVLAVVRETTEAVRHEERLVHSEERFRIAADAAKVMVYEADLERGEIAALHRIAELLGYEAEEVPKPIAWWFEQIHPDDREFCRAESQALYQNATSFRTRYRIRHKDGAYRHVEDCGRIIGDHGRALRVIGGVIDVSERERAERERLRLMEHLENALRLRDEFLSVASHELRTPLTALSLELEQLVRLPSDGEATRLHSKLHRKAETCLRQVQRLTALIEQLLCVSRLSEGKRLPLEFVRFDLVECVRSVVEELRAQAQRVGSTLAFELPAASIMVHWDRERIEQCLRILLANAFKYGPGEKVEVCLDERGERIVIEVRDRGRGLDEAVRERLFEKFGRGVPVANYGGLGLGLFIAKHVIEGHQGEIEVESKRGKGAVFRLLLPRIPLAQNVGEATMAAFFPVEATG